MAKTEKQNPKRNANRIIDFLMVLLLLLLMTYSLIGETFHEAIGTAMLVLSIVHLILHLKWWKALPKGKYTAYRTFITVLNILLLVLMLAQPLSGIAMSHHLFTFLKLSGVAGTARAIHLAASYWSFVLMSLHLGLHMDLVIRGIKKQKTDRPAGTGLWIVRIVFLLVSAYGAYAFIRRGLPGYMFLKTMFAFFDFSEPVIFFIAGYLAIMVLFAAAGYCIGKLLKKR